jgi:glutamine amidotransferase
MESNVGIQRVKSPSGFEFAPPQAAIIDFGMGNLFSVLRACEQVGMTAVISDQKEDVLKAQGVILPGVGAFGDAMAYLEKADLVGPIKDFIASGRPFLGVCLGMQLLMSESEEFGLHKGLDIIRGSVKRFPRSNGQGEPIKVPQVGWNQIWIPKGCGEKHWESTPLEGTPNGEYMHFVHSFCCHPEDPRVISSVTVYENYEYCSSLRWKNVFAAQFHPEKSAQRGVEMYKNWAHAVLNVATQRKGGF